MLRRLCHSAVAAHAGVLDRWRQPSKGHATPTETPTRGRGLCSALVQPTRHFSQRTPPRLLKVALNPAKQSYAMEHAYEEPTFRFICEGIDVDFKEEVREALKQLLPRAHSNFTQLEEHSHTVHQTMQLFRALCARQLISFAQVRSTPQRFASFYEVLVTAHPALALLAADHFTFAGLIATHASPRLQSAILEDVDSGKVLGCLPCNELIAEGAPLNTEARYDFHEKCFVLRGAGKFAVVGAECADWAIVTATLVLNKRENNGVHAFVVQLRDKGQQMPGVTIQCIKGESRLAREAGVAVVHFDDIRIPVDALLQPFCITAEGKVNYLPGMEQAPEATEVLRTRMRLATGAVYVGTLKRLFTNVVRFVAQKDVVGPDYVRNYPYFGIQHVQTPLVCMLSKFYVYLAAWHCLLPVLTDVSGKEPTYEDYMRLAGILHFMQETVMDLHKFADEFMGVHGSFSSTGSNVSAEVVHMRQEGPDTSALIREVAFKSVTKSIGTTHWGWWATNVLHAIPSLDRLVKNPLYSPRIADLGRHLIFFSHKHYGARRQLRLSREIERRKGGSEHQWYDWVMFRHRDVVHCGEAFMEMHFLEVVMEETQRCSDPRGRKLLRDMGWIYALARQMDRLDYILMKKMLSTGKATILSGHLDNLVTVLAPQCVNLVEAMSVPLQFRAPCAADDLQSYWTIPGTNTHIERGDKITLHKPQGENTGNTKAEQEEMREEESEFDLFHGLADKPSFAYKKP